MRELEYPHCVSHCIEAQFLLSKLRYRYATEKKFDVLKAERHLQQLQKVCGSLSIVWTHSDRMHVTRAMETRAKKKKRISGRIFGMQSNYPGRLLFLTLTFTDDVLQSTNELTRRRYVQRWLNEYCIEYVANVDFGKENGRQHYHAVAVPKESEIDFHTWKYGAINGKRFGNTSTDKKRVSKYLLKLVNHAGKNTSGGVIYSTLPKSAKGVFLADCPRHVSKQLGIGYTDTIMHDVTKIELDELPF